MAPSISHFFKNLNFCGGGNGDGIVVMLCFYLLTL